MRYRTYLKLALNILIHSKLRSWLTIIGIVIGVAAVLSIMSLGDSMQANVENRFAEMDLTKITISPGFSKAQSAMGHGGEGSSVSSDVELTNKDIMALKLIDDIQYMYGEISGSEDVYFLGESVSLSITGVDPQLWQYVTTVDLESGRLLEPADNFVAVIGSGVANDLFEQPVGINMVLTINGRSVRVVGIMESEGGNSDREIIMPIDAAVEIIEDAEKNNFDSIVVKVEDADLVESVAEEIETKLMISRHVTERDRDFSVSASKSMVEDMSEIMNSMNMFLGAIAAVSLVVGAVGIANTMFTSVLEKTKEIGTMKAIGARNSDIMMIFIFNALLVGFVGGAFGVIFGSIASIYLPSILGMATVGLSSELMVFGLLIAMFIGVISGAIPAYRASRMKPVDALRYE
ncbi:MAG: ABC transporter permease [Methanosarcinaceae archaeon]|nr:ABC transporter permease [Methanosarcinaceae archaeon]